MPGGRLGISIGLAAVLGPIALAAQGGPLEFSRQPYLQRLTPDSVVVVWRTNRSSLGEVRFRRPGEEPILATDGEVGREHIVRLEKLEPNSTYSYRVLAREPPGGEGDEEATVSTEEMRFRSAPADGSVPVRFAVIGDAGAGTEAQLRVRDLLETLEPDGLLVTGDLVYPLGLDELYQLRFFDVYRELLARTCVYPAFGNHDALDGGGSFDAQFVLPGVSRGERRRHYSFDFGAAHFVAIDTNSLLFPGSQQREWLVEDLKRTEQPWKIVFCHHPIYTTGPHGDDAYKLPLRAALVPVFDAAGVDLVLAGHDHVYERSFPLRDGTVRDAWQEGVYRSPRGTVYVVTGGGGARLYRRSAFDDLRYAAFQAEIHHAVHITVSASRLELEVLAVDGSRLDPIAIDRALPRPPFRVRSGDADGDAAIGMSDVVRVLAHAFLGFSMSCPASGDWDRNGVLDVTDVVRSLSFQFLGASPPPSFPDCGPVAEGLDAFCFRSPCRP